MNKKKMHALVTLVFPKEMQVKTIMDITAIRKV
jgi:hypothetical protein